MGISAIGSPARREVGQLKPATRRAAYADFLRRLRYDVWESGLALEDCIMSDKSGLLRQLLKVRGLELDPMDTQGDPSVSIFADSATSFEEDRLISMGLYSYVEPEEVYYIDPDRDELQYRREQNSLEGISTMDDGTPVPRKIAQMGRKRMSRVESAQKMRRRLQVPLERMKWQHETERLSKIRNEWAYPMATEDIATVSRHVAWRTRKPRSNCAPSPKQRRRQKLFRKAAGPKRDDRNETKTSAELEAAELRYQLHVRDAREGQGPSLGDKRPLEETPVEQLWPGAKKRRRYRPEGYNKMKAELEPYLKQETPASVSGVTMQNPQPSPAPAPATPTKDIKMSEAPGLPAGIDAAAANQWQNQPHSSIPAILGSQIAPQAATPTHPDPPGLPQQHNSTPAYSGVNTGVQKQPTGLTSTPTAPKKQPASQSPAPLSSPAGFTTGTPSKAATTAHPPSNEDMSLFTPPSSHPVSSGSSQAGPANVGPNATFGLPSLHGPGHVQAAKSTLARTTARPTSSASRLRPAGGSVARGSHAPTRSSPLSQSQSVDEDKKSPENTGQLLRKQIEHDSISKGKPVELPAESQPAEIGATMTGHGSSTYEDDRDHTVEKIEWCLESLKTLEQSTPQGPEHLGELAPDPLLPNIASFCGKTYYWANNLSEGIDPLPGVDEPVRIPDPAKLTAEWVQEADLLEKMEKIHNLIDQCCRAIEPDDDDNLFGEAGAAAEVLRRMFQAILVTRSGSSKVPLEDGDEQNGRKKPESDGEQSRYQSQSQKSPVAANGQASAGLSSDSPKTNARGGASKPPSNNKQTLANGQASAGQRKDLQTTDSSSDAPHSQMNTSQSANGHGQIGDLAMTDASDEPSKDHGSGKTSALPANGPALAGQRKDAQMIGTNNGRSGAQGQAGGPAVPTTTNSKRAPLSNADRIKRLNKFASDIQKCMKLVEPVKDGADRNNPIERTKLQDESTKDSLEHAGKILDSFYDWFTDKAGTSVSQTSEEQAPAALPEWTHKWPKGAMAKLELKNKAFIRKTITHDWLRSGQNRVMSDLRILSEDVTTVADAYGIKLPYLWVLDRLLKALLNVLCVAATSI